MTATTTATTPESRLALRSHPWLAYGARRIMRLAGSMLILLVSVSFMIHMVPGDPVRAALGETASPESIDEARTALGLDDPLPVQVTSYVRGILSGDLGTSIVSRQPVTSTIADRLPATLQLAIPAFVVAMTIAIVVGLAVAFRTRGGRGRKVELTFAATSAVVAATPEYVLAVGGVWLFAVTLGWLPVASRTGLSSYVLPVAALSIGPGLALARIVRVEALAVYSSAHIVTARAKRLSEWRILRRHVLPNALTSTLTVGGLMLRSLILGTVLVEVVFAWPGLGSELVRAILLRDYPVVQGMVLVFGATILLTNLLVDIGLALLDPRSAMREAS